MPHDHLDKGRRAEQVARNYLTNKGYALLAENWRCPQGEIDLIFRRGDALVFVEVRSRRAGVDAAALSIDARKLVRLRRAMHAYCAAHGMEDVPGQLDVIAVQFDATGVHGRLSHHQDVLGWR